MVGLQAQPEPFAGAKDGSQAHCDVCGDAALAEDDLVDAARRDASRAGKGPATDAHRNQEVMQQNLPGMDVGQTLGCTENDVLQRSIFTQKIPKTRSNVQTPGHVAPPPGSSSELRL